jgi:hypothetical protein
MNRRTFIALVVAWVLFGIRLASAGEAKPRQYVVVIDLSASRRPEMIEEERHFLEQMVDQLSFGEQIVLLQTQQEGLSDVPLRWHVVLPGLADPTFVSSRDKERLSGAKKGIKSALSMFFDTTGSAAIKHTDLFATLMVAGEFARDAAGRQTVLVLLSDLLQSDATGIEMQHGRRMPPPGWIESRRQLGLIPRLNGACIVAIGVDGTSLEGIKVRSFWLNYFSASGAIFRPENYRATPPPPENGLCR